MPDDRVTREVFWNISFPGELAFYALALLSLGLFGYGFSRHLKKVLKGKPTSLSWGMIRASLVNSVSEILSNRTIRHRHRLAGLMHLLIMWGFIALFIGTLIVSIEYDLFQKVLKQRHGFWVGSFFLGYELVLDTMGALFLVGLLVALLRRYALKRPQLTWKPIDLLLPVWLLLIGLTGFVVEGMRLAATAAELGYSPYWSPVGLFLFPRLGRRQSPDNPHVALARLVVSRSACVGMGRCASVHAQGNAHFDSGGERSAP